MMDFNEIEKAYAMGRAYAQGLKYAKLMAKLNGMAEDTKEDGFATLVDSEGQPYVANLNPKEKARYEETKKPLSQVKKEEKAKKEQEQKEAEERARKEAEAKAKKEKEKEDLFEKYWAESASAGLYQKRKEAEAKKKETKKPEVKTEEPEPDENSFKGRLKKILSTPFKKSKNDHTYHEVDPERIEKIVSRLNPDDPRSQKALDTLKKYYDEGQAWAVADVVNNIDTYTSNPESYERSLKANERSLNKSLDTFEKAEDKVYKLAQEEKKKLIDVLYERGQKLGSKLTKNQIADKVDTSQKEGRLTYLMQGVGFKSEGLRLASRIADMKKSLKNSLEAIKNFDPSKGLRFSLNLYKSSIKSLKDDVQAYLKANNMAMDSAEFQEIQAVLDDLLNDFDL